MKSLLFDLKPVVDGVWAAIARPAYKVNCNAAVITLDDGVLVVDTHSKPSAARSLIDQIKAVTDKPVKWVVNTHFHWDHYYGNQAYTNAWPGGVEIISSEATRESIQNRGIPRLKRKIVELPNEIDKLKVDIARVTDAKRKAELQHNLRQAEEYLAELKTMQVTLPTLTFDRNLILYRPSRTVQILWLGRAHTNGDVFVYLPKEKVIVTGDAVQSWMSYLGDSYPYDWVKTLEEAMKLDFEYVIGAHGEVMHGKTQFELWRDYLVDLMEATAEAIAAGESMAEAEKSVDGKLRPRYEARFPVGVYSQMHGTVPAVVVNVRKAYRIIIMDPTAV
jgi:glyoxylase-like metal-dependent hydrolase (beta-lactamase superfamily II)